MCIVCLSTSTLHLKQWQAHPVHKEYTHRSITASYIYVSASRTQCGDWKTQWRLQQANIFIRAYNYLSLYEEKDQLNGWECVVRCCKQAHLSANIRHGHIMHSNKLPLLSWINLLIFFLMSWWVIWSIKGQKTVKAKVDKFKYLILSLL